MKSINFKYIKGLPNDYGTYLFFLKEDLILTGYYNHCYIDYKPTITVLNEEEIVKWEEEEVLGYFEIIKN